MKIRSSILMRYDVEEAFRKARLLNGADIYIDEIRTFSPRAEKNGVEVWAYSNHGKQASAHAPVGSYARSDYPRAASWSDYGYVMAHLFNIDPHAQVGFYNSEADFVEQVRKYPRKGASLEFLNVLTNIEEYA